MNQDQKIINAIRMLGVDAIEKANSGHPGIVMGAAPMAYTLWAKHLNINPKNPNWENRDRFILSAGHGSMLIYALLHLSGYDVSMEDLQQFRQLNSKTPGHPEYHITPGIDATTGPLGQGIAMGVGMALAEQHLAGIFQTAATLVNHHTYILCGDGDLMEGISHEAASFAGTHHLGKLIVLYDSNNICLDGNLEEAMNDDTRKRFEAYGWQTLHVADGNDIAAIDEAITTAKANTTQPTLIEVNTIIGYGSPNKSGTNSCHGAPLGADEVANVRTTLGWEAVPFEIEKTIYTAFQQQITDRVQPIYTTWEEQKNNLSNNEKQQYDSYFNGTPKTYNFPEIPVGTKQATRNSSQDCIQLIAETTPNLFGGSADLSGSNMTKIKTEGLYSEANLQARNIQYGVREFAMASMANGMSLHGGVRPFVSTFMVFSDYLKPAARLSALMQQPVTYVFTHDSLAVGEDGATHEPVEHYAMWRSLPNTIFLRPADAVETQGAWKIAMASTDTPVVLSLTRQALTVQEKTNAAEVAKGAYIVYEPTTPEAIILATGSEVEKAITIAKALAPQHQIRVISIPSWELFAKQDTAYQQTLLPTHIQKRISIEMASTFGWERFVGHNGLCLGVDTFGASGPADAVEKAYGFDVERLCKQVEKYLVE